MPQSTPLALERPTVRSLPVAVLASGDRLLLVATQSFVAGASVIWLDGCVVTAPTRFTVQLGADIHLDAPPASSERERMERYPWLFLEHACRPNTRLGGSDGRSLLAHAPIAVGDVLTFDYEANEVEMAAPFVCDCGACDGRKVRGYAHLAPTERALRRDRLSPHLLNRNPNPR